jgi:anti-sigma regulatory factor (Ser/Thr protein kinase)
VERRRRPLTEGIAQASQAVRDSRATALGDVVTDVMARLAPANGYDDDVALLVYRQPAPLELSFPAESAQLAPVRKILRGWLQTCGLSRRTVQSALVAVGEACANAIEHGSDPAGEPAVQLHAEALAGDLHLTVVDTGRWKPPQLEADPSRGRGLLLMRALAQRVTITPGPEGTVVDMHMRIT